MSNEQVKISDEIAKFLKDKEIKYVFGIIGSANSHIFDSINQLGYNYRLTDIQSALGLSQLKKLDKFTIKRNKIAKRYNKAFKNNKNIITPKVKENINHAYHLYTLLLNFKKIGKTRNEIMTELFEHKVGSQVLYIPIYEQPYYNKKYKFKTKNYKNSQNYYNQALSIPIFPDLKPKEQNYIINLINKITN